MLLESSSLSNLGKIKAVKMVGNSTRSRCFCSSDEVSIHLYVWVYCFYDLQQRHFSESQTEGVKAISPTPYSYIMPNGEDRAAQKKGKDHD